MSDIVNRLILKNMQKRPNTYLKRNSAQILKNDFRVSLSSLKKNISCKF
jgi:hypothetical protein